MSDTKRLRSDPAFAKIQVFLASEPRLSKVLIEGKLVPVAAIATDTSFGEESYVTLRIPLAFVELEQDR